jgi:hypothetical protein
VEVTRGLVEPSLKRIRAYSGNSDMVRRSFGEGANIFGELSIPPLISVPQWSSDPVVAERQSDGLSPEPDEWGSSPRRVAKAAMMPTAARAPSTPPVMSAITSPNDATRCGSKNH